MYVGKRVHAPANKKHEFLFQTEFADIAAVLAEACAEYLAGDLKYETVGTDFVKVEKDGVEEYRVGVRNHTEKALRRVVISGKDS